MKRLGIYVITFLFILGTQKTWGQLIKSTVSPEITVCGEDEVHSITVINTLNNTMTNMDILLELPKGIAYSENSFIELNNQPFFHYPFDSQTITLHIDSLPVMDTLHFQFQIRASQAAIQEQILGTNFKNKFTLNSDQANQTHYSESYNILYASLSITEITNASEQAYYGDTLVRSLKIVNGGYGSINKLNIQNTLLEGNESLISTSIGSIVENKILLNSTDLVKIGNQNGSFERNEVILLEVQVLVQECNYTSTEIKAYWGCNENERSSDPVYAHTVILEALTASITPENSTVLHGQSFQRTITITNLANNIIPELIVEDDYNTTLLSLDSVNAGEIIEPTKVHLTGQHFKLFGNGDTLFQKGETINIEETLKAIGCYPTSSTISLVWNCNNSEVTKTIGNFPINIQVQEPNLEYSITPSFNTCVSENADAQKLILFNSGSGIAFETTLTLEMPYSDMFTAINPNSIEIKKLGSNINIPVSILSSISSDTSDLKNCLNQFIENPLRYVKLDVGNLAPNDTIEINWNNYTCRTTNCLKTKLTGWQFDLSYKNNCNGKTYNKNNITGLSSLANTSNFSTYIEGPTDLNPGEKGNYKFTFYNASFNPSIVTPSSYYVFDIEKPKNLRWSQNDQITLNNYNYVKTPDFTITNEDSSLLSIFFKAPNNISFNNAFLQLALEFDTTDFTISENEMNIRLDLSYIPNYDCSDPYKMFLTCDRQITTQGQIKDHYCEGIFLDGIETSRINLGKPDNNQDGLPDTNASFDFSKITLNRVMESDTIVSVYNAIVQSKSDQEWQYGTLEILIPTFFAPYLKYEKNNFTIKTLEDSIYHGVLSVAETFTSNNDKLLQLTLNTQDIESLNIGPFKNGDTLTIQLYHIIKGNIGPSLNYVKLSNNLYLSNHVNPNESEKYVCNQRSSHFTLIGYEFYSGNNNSVLFNQCTQNINQHFYFNLGGINNSGSDLFPYEYRNWAYLDSLVVNIPRGYEVKNIQIKQNRTKYLNAKVTEYSDSISFTQANIEYTSNIVWGSLKNTHIKDENLNLSDDGFDGTITIELEPHCDKILANSYEEVNWKFLLKKTYTSLDEQIIHMFGTPDNIKYQPADLAISSTEPIKVGNGPYVTWTITVKNNGKGYASNVFLHALSPNNTLSLINIKDDSGNSLANNEGIYYSNDLAQGEEREYLITAEYSSCHEDQLIVYSGYDCKGFPQTFEEYNCSERFLFLRAVPNSSELQARIRSYGEQDCSPTVNMEIEFSSVRLAHVKDIKIEVEGSDSNSISIWPGSSKIIYPDYNMEEVIPDPISINDAFIYQHDSMNLPYTLPGIYQPDSNTALLRFTVVLNESFSLGKFLKAHISAKRVCGESLPQKTLFLDPYAIYTQPNAGFVEHGDNWGMAWGDYDNDGFADLFVTNYNATQPNILYHNEGNGVFNTIKTGSIATDIASSLSASWGDYDNDGDLDLFVANNIGSENFLYNNDGQGNFSRVMDDPIVKYNSYAHSCSWVDINNDGFLDMYIADYFPTTHNALYLNNNGQGFSRINNSSIVEKTTHSVTAAWADFDNDGNMDVFIANTNGENNNLYRNIGNGMFEEILDGDIVNDHSNSVGASWGDYNNDGYIDLFVTNAARTQPNMLFKNLGNATFEKIQSGSIVNTPASSHGSTWIDINNDGYLDLIVTNDNNENNFLYINNGDETFTDTKNSITQSGGFSFGVGSADYDMDGDLDIFIANHKDALNNPTQNYFFENQRGNCSSTLCVQLQGTRSSKNAIGTVLEVNAIIQGKPVQQFRQITTQSGGLGSQNDSKQFFGLGDANNIDSIIINWPSGLRQTLYNISVDTCLYIIEPNAGTLTVKAFYDENLNCLLDENEGYISGVEVKIQSNTSVKSIFTNDLGMFESNLNPGSYELIPIYSGIWDGGCSKIGEVTLNNNTHINVPFFPSCNSYDLSIEMATTVVRPGFDTDYFIKIKNNGAKKSESTPLKVVLPETFSAVSATPTWTTSEDSIIYWEVPALEQNQDTLIIFTINASPDVQIGEDVSVFAQLENIQNDCIAQNNQLDYTKTTVGAIDPNEKHVNPIGKTEKHFIENEQTLTYQILFQNKGTYPATYVTIIDTLDEHLDIKTLNINLSSHNAEIEVLEDRVIKWYFENIHLPTEQDDEKGSNGFVQFTISPKRNLPENTNIKNNALIYFDYSDPIQTNTVFNTVNNSFFEYSNNNYVQCFPNPANEQFTISIQEEDMITNLEIKDISGKIIYQNNKLSTHQVSLKNEWKPGSYFIELTNIESKKYFSRIVLQ